MEFLKNLIPSLFQILLGILVLGLLAILPFFSGHFSYKYFKVKEKRSLAVISYILIVLAFLAVYFYFTYKTLFPPFERLDMLYTEITHKKFPPKAKILSKSNTVIIGENLQDYKLFNIKTIAFASIDSAERVELLNNLLRDTCFVNDYKINGKNFEYLNGKLEGRRVKHCFANKDTTDFKLIGFLDDDSTIVFQKGY